MAKFLQNTSLASVAQSKTEIYTYAQSYFGPIYEIHGKLAGSSDTYTRTGSPVSIGPTDEDLPARRLTPIAAVVTKDWNTKEDRRYVFYLNNVNQLCDAYYGYKDKEWHKGDLYSKNWVAAPYSRLAAFRLTNSIGADFICVYYQNTADNGDVQQVNYSHSGWNVGPAPFNDPPLFGTSLSGAKPEAGIRSQASVQTTDTKLTAQPVVFFQYDNLYLGSTQDLGDSDYKLYNIEDPKRTLSAHASIAAVDDGTNCWTFYTSDDNTVQIVRVDASGNVHQPTTVNLDQTPIPASPLTAVLIAGTPEKIVLFYLLHWEAKRKTTETTDVWATTLTKKSDDTWESSSREPLYR